MSDHSIPMTLNGEVVGRARIAGNEHVSFELDWKSNSMLGNLMANGVVKELALDSTIRMTEVKRQSNLVDHARRELKLVGEDDVTIEGLLNVIQAFADMGHSGGSASVAIPMLYELLQFKNLTPLTDDPDEWQHAGPEIYPPDGIWQNRRNSAAFSHDGGKTYYLLSEGASDADREPLHTSFHKEL